MLTEAPPLNLAASSRDRAKEWALIALAAAAVTITFSISFFEITGGIFIGLSAISFFRHGRRTEVFGATLLILMGIYLAAAALSVTQTHFYEAAFRGVFKIVRSLLVCLCAAYVIDSPEKLRKVVQVFLFAGILIGIDAVFQAVTGTDFLRGRKMTPYYAGTTDRWTGPYKHANDFSAYLSLLFFVYLGAALYGRRVFGGLRWAIYLVGFALAATCLLNTYSRAAWLTVAATLALWAVLRRNRWMLGVIAIFAVWLVFLSPPLVQHRIRSLWTEGGTVTERKELWGESFRMIRKSPVIGLGVNTYAKNEPLFKEAGSRSDHQYAHNGYLQITAETGFLGLAAFLAVLAYFLVASYRRLSAATDPFLKGAGLSFWFGITAFLLHSNFDTNLQSLPLVNLMWLSVGIVWAASRLAGARS